jgi:hypothetical protein
MRINLITGRRRASLPLSCEGGRPRGDGGTGRGEPGSGEGRNNRARNSPSAQHSVHQHFRAALLWRFIMGPTAKLVLAWGCHCELEAL